MNFEQYNEHDAFERALDSFPKPEGQTRIDVALEAAYRDLFSVGSKVCDVRLNVFAFLLLMLCYSLYCI